MMPVMAFGTTVGATVNVASADELNKVLADTQVNPVIYKNLTINITEDIDMDTATTDAQSGMVDGYDGAGLTIVNGNGHVIKNLKKPLFSGTWAGGDSGLVIKDLTISNANISEDPNDTVGTVAVGAFVASPSSSGLGIVLKNCHLIESTVEGGHWTGGLIGYNTGYSKQDDGPVFMNVSIDGCSVVDCTITGKGSVGGVIGHATGDTWSKVEIVNTTVNGNKVSSTGSSNMKAGSVVGTVGAGGANTVAGKAGEVIVNATVKDNVVTSNNTAIERVYGRFGSAGILNITGGKYHDCTEADNLAKPDAGTLIIAEEALFGEEIKAQIDITIQDLPTVDATKPVEKVEVGTSEETKEVLADTSAEVIEAVTKGEEVKNVDEKVVEAIEEAVAAGDDVEVTTTVVATPVDEKDVEATFGKDNVVLVEKAAGDATVAQYLDLSVLMTVSVNGQEVATGEVEELAKEVTFTIAIPEELKAVKEGITREYYVIRVHDGKTDKLPVTVNDDGTLSFKTDRFSTYALAYEDKETPKTGDANAMMPWLAVMAVTAVGAVALKRKEN